MTANHAYLTRRFAKTPTFATQAVVDEIVLLQVHQDDASAYTLNPVGARIWNLIDGQRQVEQIRDMIVDDFEISPDVAETDLIAFMKQLEQAGAVEPV
ncbi:MAG: PqqD family protein [Anaerolineae bacterium]|nr:PqqD family protein [Anaerolineae bacterium]